VEVRTRLARAIASAQSALADEPIRWVRLEILHLTLRFLGETAPATLERVRQAASERSPSWKRFELRVGGLGCFPDCHRPRVIWAGAADDSGTLVGIAEDLEHIAREFGFPAEQRPFAAHLTIGRVKDRLSADGGRRLAEVVLQSQGEAYGSVEVGAIELLGSDLRPGGPIYTRLATLDLAG
jgi:2'-5' RNA ligase